MILLLVLTGTLAGAARGSGPQAPRPVPPQQAGVGRLVPDLSATDVTGKPVKLSEVGKNRKAVVVALTSTSCPISQKYLPALARLEKAYGSKGVAFVYLNPAATDTPETIRKARDSSGVVGPYVHDKDGSLARAIGAESTGDVFVLDAKRTVIYRGAVDDQYGFGYSRDAATHTYLTDALDAVLAGTAVKIRATEAPGCALELGDATGGPITAITYHNRVSRIMQSYCVECHRAGGVGPFPLDTLAEVVAHKAMLRKAVDKGTMPPWHAAAAPKGTPSPWANDRSMTTADKADLFAWLSGGAAAGDPADAPLPRVFPTEWSIGTPDLVVQIPKPIAVKAEGTMPYQNVTVETNVDEDKWVQAVEVRPTARAVVHHVLVFKTQIGDTKQAGTLTRLLAARAEAEERRGFFAAYVPGSTFEVFPDGFAKKLPKGSKLRFQIHYTRTAPRPRTKCGSASSSPSGRPTTKSRCSASPTRRSRSRPAPKTIPKRLSSASRPT
ncbi:redoxin family protein [Fimbriiglobus ruber]|uniref:Thioredoxin domain-containing protein n=1 Tax=Fimbriiglobus ruber TaxID=1908690 RepID=A0A225DD04_9BACT|nr:redoxin family protein [Fimbriiglobus ruber]OWK38853.1 hypothetical protein FRUB_06358 [Fimbriiglobus ruber]